MNRVAIVFALPLILSSDTPSFGLQAIDSRHLSQQEAAELVMKALPRKTATAPGVELDPRDDPDFPDFFFFEVLWRNPQPGSVIAGHYAVHRRTGEVWEEVLCERVTSSAVRRLQQRIRRRIGLTNKEYLKLQRQSPCSN